jgi:hypothetical protein
MGWYVTVNKLVLSYLLLRLLPHQSDLFLSRDHSTIIPLGFHCHAESKQYHYCSPLKNRLESFVILCFLFLQMYIFCYSNRFWNLRMIAITLISRYCGGHTYTYSAPQGQISVNIRELTAVHLHTAVGLVLRAYCAGPIAVGQSLGPTPVDLFLWAFCYRTVDVLVYCCGCMLWAVLWEYCFASNAVGLLIWSIAVGLCCCRPVAVALLYS